MGQPLTGRPLHGPRKEEALFLDDRFNAVTLCVLESLGVWVQTIAKTYIKLYVDHVRRLPLLLSRYVDMFPFRKQRFGRAVSILV